MNAPTPEFLTKIPETPLLDQVGKSVVKTFDDLINGAIHAIGDKFGHMIDSLKEMKGAVFNVGGGSTDQAVDRTASPTPTSTPSIAKSLGQSQELKVAVEIPTIAKKQVQSLPDVKVAAAVNVPDGTMVCPMCTPTIGAGMAQGRGGMNI